MGRIFNSVKLKILKLALKTMLVLLHALIALLTFTFSDPVLAARLQGRHASGVGRFSRGRLGVSRRGHFQGDSGGPASVHYHGGHHCHHEQLLCFSALGCLPFCYTGWMWVHLHHALQTDACTHMHKHTHAHAHTHTCTCWVLFGIHVLHCFTLWDRRCSHSELFGVV